MTSGRPRPENRCTATNRQGERCGRPVVKGKKVCRFHGGKSLKGHEVKKFKHGKYSKYLPRNLQERYQLFLDDPERESMGNEIALLDVRLSMLAEGIETDDWGTVTKTKIYALWSELMSAIRSGDVAAQAAKVSEIDDFLSDSERHEGVWKDIERVSEVRRKSADSEMRRMEKQNQMLTVEQAMMLITSLVNSLREVVFLYVDSETAGHIIEGTTKAYYELVGGEPEGSGSNTQLALGREDQ